MIDLCQWRASIGLWHCCQATLNCCHLKETIGDSKPGSSEFISGQKQQLTAIISFIICLLAQLLLELLHQFFITGKAMKWLQSEPDRSINHVFLLILSGDIELNPGPTGKSTHLLQAHTSSIIVAITTDLYGIANRLFACNLISMEIRNETVTLIGLSDYSKASRLISDILSTLRASQDPDQYLTKVCHVFIESRNERLANIAEHMLSELSSSRPTSSAVEDKSIHLEPSDLNELLSINELYVPGKWQTLGIHLGLSIDTLDEIGTSRSNNDECYINCLSLWLKGAGNSRPTWDSLIGAQEAIGEYEVAQKIRRYIEKDSHPGIIELYDKYLVPPDAKKQTEVEASGHQKGVPNLELLKQKKPLQEDLIKIFKIAAIYYNIIGTGLGVDVADLIQQPQSDTNKLILVFNRWIDSNNNVTWGKILEVCEDYPNQLGQAEASLRKFLSSEETCRKYLHKIPDKIIPPPDKKCSKKIKRCLITIILVVIFIVIIYHSHFYFKFEW